ncbi:MAG: hypothetical protein ACUVXA_13870 [Candidatus Jordarchaeum sp.]|uniref:hypothetical protein n=1 Tax=Candidatus Jordarchaeum sp. TaxID=2823881 RepID=UPI00404A6670
MGVGEETRDKANQEEDLEKYFLSNTIFTLFFGIVFLTVIVLLIYVSNLLYGNPLINYILYGETGGKLLFSIILMVLIIGVYVYGLIRYRKKIYWKTPPYVSKKLNAVFAIGFIWLWLSGLYFIREFSSFLSDFGTYTSYCLFNGYSYYLTGDFSFAMNYNMIFPMVQSVSENWAFWLYWLILPMFMVSLLMVIGGFLYVKHKK